jgi:hypothetical protein
MSKLRELSGHYRKHASANMIYKRSRHFLRIVHFARSGTCVLTVGWIEVLYRLCCWIVQRVTVQQLSCRGRITLISAMLGRP